MAYTTSTRGENIWVKIIRAGYIPQLGIQGPIPNPVQITRAKAHSMIVAGIDVFEVDPKTKKTTKLTIQNVFGNTSGLNNDMIQKHESVKNIPNNAANQPKNDTISFNGVSNQNNNSKKNNQKNNKNNNRQKSNNEPVSQAEKAETDVISSEE